MSDLPEKTKSYVAWSAETNESELPTKKTPTYLDRIRIEHGGAADYVWSGIELRAIQQFSNQKYFLMGSGDIVTIKDTDIPPPLSVPMAVSVSEFQEKTNFTLRSPSEHSTFPAWDTACWINDCDIPDPRISIDPRITVEANGGAKKDEVLPDWHGPKGHHDEGYYPHKRVYDAATDLLNGRVTNAGARKELRRALDVADKSAAPKSPMIGKL